jgi:hypothetical protein
MEMVCCCCALLCCGSMLSVGALQCIGEISIAEFREGVASLFSLLKQPYNEAMVSRSGRFAALRTALPHACSPHLFLLCSLIAHMDKDKNGSLRYVSCGLT